MLEMIFILKPETKHELEYMHLNFFIYGQPAHPSMKFDVCGQSYILSSQHIEAK